MLYYTLKRLGDTEKVASGKSNSLLAKKLTTPATNGNDISPSINWFEDSNFCLSFKGSCLKQRNTLLIFLIKFFFYCL